MNREARTAMVSVLAFFAGAGMGAVAGLLAAPHSGRYTRRQLQNFAEDVEDRAALMASDAKLAVRDAIQHVRNGST